MLVLFETAAGYALFKVLKEKRLEQVEVRVAWAGGGGYWVAPCCLTGRMSMCGRRRLLP